jgi:hypothetical protein
MNTALLQKLFGTDSRWQGPCTLILDAGAAVQTLGADSMGPSAVKNYAPRLVSGRIAADVVSWTPDGTAVLAVQQQKMLQGSGEVVKQTLLVLDPARVVAVEFIDTAVLGKLGVGAPPLRPGSHPGTHRRPENIATQSSKSQ